jgi:integrase
MAEKLLSATFVERTTKLGRHCDGGGLYLRVRRGKRGLLKRWLMRWKPKGQHAYFAKEIHIGDTATYSLAQARERAAEIRRQIAEGKDPAQQRRDLFAARAAEAVKVISFKEAAERFLIDKPRDASWHQTLGAYAYPVIGGMPIAAIDTVHVADVLRPHWKSKHVTMKRLRGRLEAICGWAASMRLRSGENPARWRDNLDSIFDNSKDEVEGHNSLYYDAVPAAMMKLAASDGIVERALEMIALTASRAGEVTGMDWRELDLGNKLWVIPKERTKQKREQRVPLSARAIEILSALGPKSEGLVFPAWRTGKRMKAQTLAQLLKKLAGDDTVTLHGLRASFSTWASHRTSFADEVIEDALGHVYGSKQRRAYKRGDLLPKRVKLMDAWDGFCAGRTVGEVVPIRRTA